MSDIVETKGTQPNQIPKYKFNMCDANYKLIVIQRAEKLATANLQENLILTNPVFDGGENRRNCV